MTGRILMNLSKSFEFFDPALCKERVHIIGAGSVGSTVAELLARFGITRFSIYDFDTVEPKNIVNQMFTYEHIGMNKVDAIEEIIRNINPEITVRKYKEGWTGQPLDGYVFLAVDNIETRRQIVKDNLYNDYVKAMFDFRTGLTDGQHYAADWKEYKSRKNLLETMNFSHEEAKLNSPVSACNVELCVAPTVRMICNAGVTNFINYLKGQDLYKIITLDAFNLEKGIDAI
jgi:molybdopterin/thiamine biosynthesis adenylyltransferase